MLKVGITGGIGSGKSTVCHIFQILGIPVYYADLEAKLLINTDKNIHDGIISILGVDAYAGGTYNVSYVKSKVFNDQELLVSLNKIVHPAVKLHSERWMMEHWSHPYVLKEAAIMERGAGLDYIIYVHADKKVRLLRTLQRDSNRSQEEILEIMKKQKQEEEFKEMSDFVIENQNRLLIPQVLEIHKNLLDLSTS